MFMYIALVSEKLDKTHVLHTTVPTIENESNSADNFHLFIATANQKAAFISLAVIG